MLNRWWGHQQRLQGHQQRLQIVGWDTNKGEGRLDENGKLGRFHKILPTFQAFQTKKSPTDYSIGLFSVL